MLRFILSRALADVRWQALRVGVLCFHGVCLLPWPQLSQRAPRPPPLLGFQCVESRATEPGRASTRWSPRLGGQLLHHCFW